MTRPGQMIPLWMPPLLAFALTMATVIPQVSSFIISHASLASSHCGASLSSTSSDSFDASSLLYQEQEKVLVDRGKYEGELMAHHTSGIKASIVKKGSGGGGGFGASKGSRKSQQKTEAKYHAKGLREQGVVRINNVLPAALADEMRDYVMKLRQDSQEVVASGKMKSRERFANVLLKENRCDLTLPLSNELTADCLLAVLQQSAVGETMSKLLSKNAVLYELSCLISDPGSNRQVMHPDTPCAAGDEDPVLYTCFVALQDIELDMGPTTWMPGTHNLAAHEQFFDERPRTTGKSPKDTLLEERHVVLGLLPKGSCGIFDSRLLHCGGANTCSSEQSRAVFYFSWKNPAVSNAGNPGSIRPVYINQWTLQGLDKELTKHGKGKSSIIGSDRDSFES